jgi:hypothetical protein
MEEFPMAEKLEEVTFEYTRAPDFHTVHADGIFGGPTPAKQLRIEFFVSLPKSQTKEIAPVKEKVKDEEIEKIGAEPGVIVREKQVCVIMSAEAAKSFLGWLQKKVDTLG